MTSYWTEHAQLPSGLASRVRIRVEGERIGPVDVGIDPAPGDERLSGVVLPGFANGHSHAFHRALRGRTHSGGGTFWTWRMLMYEVAALLTPDSYLDLARAAYAEMALAGMTAVGEFHYVHHDSSGRRYADPNAMGKALIEAATQAGIRLTLLDACYLTGGLTAAGHEPLNAVQQRFSDRDVDSWAARVEALRGSDTVRIGSAIHSLRAVPGAALTQLGKLAPAGPLHIHLSEQPAENAAVQGFYGCTPAELLGSHGLLSSRLTAVHATHLTDRDISLLGLARATACLCPTTERDLADGIGPARALVAAGCPISLGSDQHAVVDMFEEMRGLEMHERLRTGERGCFRPAELLTAASSAGYASLGWDGGRLAEGAPADFVVVRADSVRTLGCAPDQIAYAATAADVDRVVVAGRTVVRDGEHRLGRVAPLLAHALAGVEHRG